MKELRILLTGVDITEHVKAEEELASVNKSGRLYLDLMAHDISNFLQGILMAAELLKYAVEDSFQKVSIDSILDFVDECTSLIRKVKRVDGLEDRPIIGISLNEVLDASIDWMKIDNKDVIVESKFAVRDAWVAGNDFLEILFKILLENAVKHNHSPIRRVWIGLDRENEGYLVSIQDNGMGMTKDQKVRITNPGKRISGVGIFQARQIAEYFGGYLSLMDRVPPKTELGIEVRIWLPEFR